MRLKLHFLYAFAFISFPLIALASPDSNVKNTLNTKESIQKSDRKIELNQDFIFNTKQILFGNPFGLVNTNLFKFSSVLAVNFSSTNVTCFGLDNGTITITGSSGTPPFLLFNIAGPVTQQNTTGVFAGLPPGVYTISVSDSVGAVETDTVTITEPAQLVATLTGDTSVCPGTGATLSFTGTPGAIVFYQSTSGIFANVLLNAAGQASATTPALNNPTVFSIYSIALSGCSNSSTSTFSVTVNSNGCASVTAGNINLEVPAALCSVGESVQLSAAYQDLGSTTAYTVSQIDYCPQAAFQGPGFTPVSVNVDDVWSGNIPLPFNFCFFGANYTTANVGSNGVLSFDTYAAGANCAWSFPATDIPYASFPIRNAIYGVYQDINPGVAPTPPAVTSINYQLMGTYPCRKLVVNFANVPQFSCNNSVGLQTSQIVIYEISNIIEVYVERRVPCPGWNGGRGIIGIQNFPGTVAYVPPGRNASNNNWSAFNEAWRFTPSGPSATTFQWLQAGVPIGTTPTITVTPPATTTYTARATYNMCGQIFIEESDVTVDVNPDPTNAPNDITQCSNTFNLTQNDAVILGSLSPFDQIIRYYTDANDAQIIASNQIPNPTTFFSTGQTIYASIEDQNSGCIRVKPFDLIVTTSGTPDPQPTAMTPLCDLNNDGFETFDLTVASSNALNGLPAAEFTVTYHNTFASAVSGTPFIAAPAAYVGSEGEDIYIRVVQDCNPVVFGTTQITLSVIPTPIVPILPNITVCDSYTLPSLTVGNYFSAPGGTGTPYTVGQNITSTSTIYIYAESGTTPNCFTESSFVVTVNVTPQVSTPADVVNCGPYTLPSVAVGNYFSGPSGTGTPYFAGNSIPASMTMYLYAQTATVPNCFTQSSFDILIVAPPTIVNPSPLVLCDDDNNGLQTFNLLSSIPQITAGQPNLVVTFHETDTDALLGVNAIPNPGAYPMIMLNIQTIHVNVKETGATANCAALTTLQLIVNPRPVLNNAVADYELCDYNNPGDGIEVFNLTTRASEVTNNQAGLILTYAYDNAGVMTPITTPTAFSNTTPNQQVIFVTAQNSFGCTTTTQFNVVVNPLPAITPPSPMFECNDGVNLTTASFDLTERNNQITGGLPGLTVSYYLNLANAQQEINPLPIPYIGSNGQIVYVRVENDNTTCFTTTTLELFVVPGPIANTPTPLSYCDPNNDNVGIFDLTSVANQITAGQTTSVLTYHETFTDADLGVTPIANPSNYPSIAIATGTQPVFIRVTSTLTACYAVVELQLFVNPTPVLVPTALPLQVCDDNADGIGVFDLTQSINNILNGLNPALHTVSFHTTEANAQTDSNPIINVLNFSNSTPNTQVIWVRVEISATGCFSIVPLTLTVNALPSLPLSLPSYSLCETDPENEQELFAIRDYAEAQLPTPGFSLDFYFSQANADAGINALPDVYQNVSNPQTIWVVVTNETTGCSSKTVLDLRVEPRPILLIPVGGLSQCDANGQGYGNFDLTAEIPSLLNGATGVEVTFYDTEQDAILEVDAIGSPYANTTPYLQFIYIRAENTLTGCYRVYMMALNVSPSPIIPTDLPNLTNCDQDNNPQSGTTPFNLTLQNPLIIAAQPQGLGTYTIRYFTTEANAQNNTSAIVTTTNYPNFSNPQTIWYRVINNTTGCYSIGTFELIVNLPLALTTPTPFAQCNPDNDNFMVFDLTTKDAEINQGTGYTVTYYPTFAQALTQTNPITNPTAYTNLAVAQTLGVVVTTPQGCTSVISLTIRVLPTPIVVTPPLLEACDNTTPGDNQEAFDLTTYENIIRNNDPDLTFAYYPTQADALAGTNQIADPTNYVTTTGSVWIKAMNLQQPTAGVFCFTLVEQLLQLNPLPTVAATVGDYVICEPNTDGVASFVLSTKNAEVVAPQDPSGFAISYHLSLADAQAGTNALPNNYTNTTNPQTVYVRVVDNVTGCVNATVSFDLLVEEGAIANPVPATTAGLTVCDEDTTNDGFTTFDLTPFGAIVLGTTQTEPDYALSYFESQADAQAGTNAIANPANYTNTNNPQEIWIRVTNTVTTSQCASLSMITLTVNELPELVVEDAFICVDPVTLQPLGTYTIVPIIDDASLYTYVWYFDGVEIAGATDATLTVSEDGNYGVIATNIATGCAMLASETMTLANTSAAIIGDVTVSNAFSENQTITVNLAGGLGDYEYQLDFGPFQDSNVFTNVSAGEHTVTVRDKNNGGCDTVTTVATAINYPLFFTPNGDGFNDTWNIVGLANQPNTKIYIFDRYGKLIKQISPTSTGWDGTYNGNQLPSTDYWFTVTFEEEGQNKEFKAHFSLKR